jgi:hypothetical protein
MPRPPLYRDRDQTATNLANAIENPGPVDPSTAVPLRAHSIANLAELRKTIGSIDGNAGPRACTLAGQLAPLDSGAGVFIWDPTSTLADNATQSATAFTVATVTGVAQGRWRRLSIGGPRSITSGTSYTPTPGTKSIVIELWGGGGGGGSTPITAAATSAAGAGGGSGGYLLKRLAGIGAGPFTIQVGAGGAGGFPGNSGTTTTFNDGVTTYTAGFGVGGGSSNAVAVITPVLAGAGAGASANGDVNGAGVPGSPGLVLTTVSALSGNGGSTSLGGGGAGVVTSTAGVAAIANTGSGGGGAAANNSAALAGGNGAAGRIIITELFA